MTNTPRASRLEGMELSSPPLSRSQSVSSERPQAFRFPTVMTPPASTSLAPAYIAASAASQIVTTDHDAHAYSWFTEEGIAPSGETALVSPNSLKLINAFLDQLLHNFLSVSRATTLTALRPAVFEVLKPTLAKEAIAGADQELSEYLGSGDDDELLGPYEGMDAPADWDTDVAWKQTRLRCMVYSSLGDVEEEDEDTYLEQEQLNLPNGDAGPDGHTSFIVSPAVAIFLTSILEFIGEQTLIVAGQAAYQRLRSRRRESEASRSANEIAERVVVEELDTEKVALNSTLGRLWRSWRKRLRSSNISGRPLSRDSVLRRYAHSHASSSRRSSFDAAEGHSAVPAHSRTISLAEVLEEDVAAFIPLPVSSYDVEEIEVPGLADLEPALIDQTRANAASVTGRPRSLLHWPVAPDQPAVTTSLEKPVAADQTPIASPQKRSRAQSLPPPPRSPAADADDAPETTVTTPRQAHLSKSEIPGAKPQGPDTAAAREESALPDAKAAESKPTPAVLAGPGRQTSTDAQQTLPTEPDFDETPTREAPGKEARRSKASRTSTTRDAQDAPFFESDSENETAQEEDPAAIGVARTSNKSVPAVAYSPPLSAGHERQRSRGIGPDGSDESIPRKTDTHRAHPSIGRIEAERAAGSVVDENATKAVKEPLSARRDGIPSKLVPSTGSASEQGPPPLTPLRELMEAAVDTSDDASSTTASQQIPPTSEPQAPSEASVRSHSSGLDGAGPARVVHVRNLSRSNRSVTPTVPASPTAERAGVQRVYTPSLTSKDASGVRRSESFGKGQAAGFSTASSPTHGATKVKIIAPRDDLEKHSLASRSSEENRSVRSDRYMATAVKSSDRGKSFEMLMESNETMKYTLTPQNMRDMEVPESPRYGQFQTGTSDLADFIRNTGPPSPTVGRSSSQRSKLVPNPINVIRAHAASSQPGGMGKLSPTLSISSTTSSLKRLVPISSPAPLPSVQSAIARSRPGIPLAREARVDRSSTRDFADFIRSTGPDAEAQPRSGSLSGPSSSQGPKRGVLVKSPSSQFAPPARPDSAASDVSRPKPRLTARDAAVRQKNDDLIDFIRQGPPADGPGARSPPVRTNGPLIPSAVGTSNRMAGTTSSSSLFNGSMNSQPQSMTSSMNSQSALLDKGGAPQRKQRRIKDPYAIDIDDEDEEEYAATPRAQQEDESLMDFLKNVPPSNAPTTTSVFSDVPKPAGRGAAAVSNGAGPSRPLMASATKGEGKPLPAQPRGAQHLGNGVSSAGRDILPDRGPKAQTNGTSRQGPIPRRPAGVARQGRVDDGSSRDLAAFLRSSGPPEPPVSYQPMVKESSGGFAKLFRKKKTTSVA